MKKRCGLRQLLMISTLFCAASLSVSVNSAESTHESSLHDAGFGSLMIDGSVPGRYSQLKAQDTRVTIGVTGMLATHEVVQRFVNPDQQWLEATYVFPLPDNAAVDQLTMRIGERQISGDIQTREQARQTYLKARSNGQLSSLVERQRANLFTTRVANIPPGETVEITIAYQSSVRYDEGIFSLSLPMTMTPRYIPGGQFSTQRLNSDNTITSNANGGWGVSDAHEISPPVTADTPYASLSVELNSGAPLHRVYSDTHKLQIVTEDLSWHIVPESGRVPMNRDFNLYWQPVPGSSPLAALFTQSSVARDGTAGNYYSLMLVPPQQLFNENKVSREVIFVIDKSGSMGGTSMPAAKRALQQGIQSLSSQDRFNVISFSNNSELMFAGAVEANAFNRRRAVAQVGMLTAGGGTEIMGAFRAALRGDAQVKANTIRQIVFITDGSVGNEGEVFDYVKSNLGINRVFTVGIGSAPNRWFMRKTAELGRGTYTYISNSAEVDRKIQSLLFKLERPVLTNVAINFDGIDAVEYYPAVIPDLYAGEPVLVDARSSGDGSVEGEVVISGDYQGVSWQRSFKIDSAGGISQSGLDKLWAHRKIEALENSLLHSDDKIAIEQRATDTALAYGLVSKYTSLVAVENPVLRQVHSEALVGKKVPLATPSGATGSDSGSGASDVKNSAGNASQAPDASAPNGNSAPGIIVSNRGGDGVDVPEGNLGIALRILLSIVLTFGVGLYSKLAQRFNHAKT